jgi:hypothetical protein
MRQRLNHTRTAVVLVALTVALAGCGALASSVQGTGKQAAEKRNMPAFERIDIAGETDVTVASGEPTVTVRGDDNLIPEVVTEVDDGTLLIDERQRLDPRAGLIVEVTTPRLSGATLHGSGNLTARDVGGGTFTADLSGSGALQASGQVQQVDLTVSGSGKADLGGLAAQAATVEASGSGDALVQVSDVLEASSSGSGDVIYAGDPQDVRDDTSGSGAIRPQ